MFEQFADEYSYAAWILAQHKSTRKGYNDFSTLPIMFLYRHAVELYLKGIFIYGKCIDALKSNSKIPTDLFSFNHKLEWFVPELKSICRMASWEWPPIIQLKNETIELPQVILELSKVDMSSTTFRYPFTKKTRETPINKSINFDIYRFALILKNTCELLSGACMGLNHQLSNFE
ncbi:MAG: hypothetical protein R3F48_04065 [Candidatus Zixiibacteriota bacterium]